MKVIKVCSIVMMALCFETAFAQEPWSDRNLLRPKDLAMQMAERTKTDPLLLFVGFPVLYRSVHIRGAIMAGPCSKPEGLNALKNAVRGVPRTRPVIVYCGCCPFVKCPNVQPAYAALRQIGFTNIKVVEMATNFHTDWVAKGFPVERSAAPIADSSR